MPRNMSNADHSVLLEEYRLAYSTIVSLAEQGIQLGQVLFLTSLGAFAILLTVKLGTGTALVASILAAAVSCALVTVWYRTSQRFTSVAGVLFLRCREIEDELGMWSMTYEAYLVDTNNAQFTGFPVNGLRRLSEMKTVIMAKGYDHKPVTPRLRNLQYLVFFLWFAMIVVQGIGFANRTGNSIFLAPLFAEDVLVTATPTVVPSPVASPTP